MGYPDAMGRGTSRTDATLARNLAPMAFWCRNSSRISRRQKAVGASSRSTGAGRLCVSTRRAWRPGERGEAGRSPAQKHGALCADRLRKKRTARASVVVTSALTTVSIKCEWPLRQSADWKPTAVNLSLLQILKLKGLEAAHLSSRVQ